MSGSRSAKQVVICGGGVAAVEALLALRALVQVGIEVHLVAPNRHFVYQPLAVAAAFGLAETHLFELAELCGEQDARLHEDALESVDAHARRVRLASGEELTYDALVVAVGAWRVDWLEGALHFGGAADVKAFQSALARVASGRETRLCFVSPAGFGWTLPAYELALLSASYFADAGAIGIELTAVTPESDPLAVFGPAAGSMVRNLLADRGIALKTDAHARRLEHGQLHFETGPPLAVDEVVALAALEGHAIAGLPCDVSGFLPVDERGRVEGFADVYGAGDGTTFPIKQGGIAAQQADAVAEAIAARLGAAITPSRQQPMLRGMLLTGIAPAYLRAQLAGGAERSSEVAVNPLWWPPAKIAGRHLAPYLAGHDSLTREEPLADLEPSHRDPASTERLHDEARELALMFAERDGADRHFDSALEWLEVVEQLDGLLPAGCVEKRHRWQRAAGRRT